MGIQSNGRDWCRRRVFLVCCVLPVSYLLAVSLTDAETYASILLDARQRQLLSNTALLGAGTALLATAIGSPLGFALARISLRRKAVLRLALATPVLLPPYIVGLAWTYFGGTRGWLTTIVGAGLVSDWTYSLPAAIVVLSLVFYPVSMLATEAAMRGIDGRLEEAALVVASPARVLRRITLPLAAPAVFSAALIIFVLAVSEFGVPGLLQVRVYTTEVFTAFAALYDVPRAILLAVPLLVLCLGIAARRRAARRAYPGHATQCRRPSRSLRRVARDGDRRCTCRGRRRARPAPCDSCR